jgi:thiamine-monophosphate kinase
MESQVVGWILENLPCSRKSLIGNGDDCAVLNINGSNVLVATDMLMDGTHFMSDQLPPNLIGHKAVAVNFSDLAAMGGVPSAVFISLAVPKNISFTWVQDMLLGAHKIAGQFNCGIDGGDTNSWHSGVVINVSVLGTPHWRGPVRRCGARTGDVIMVTGQSLGGSLISGRHASFTPRISEAQWILDRYPIHSMIDLSDGIATDSKHLASASNKKFILSTPALRRLSRTPNNMKSLFCDGEDFELLFTCSLDVAQTLTKNFPWPCGLQVIGHVTDGAGVFLDENNGTKPSPLEFSGYQH